MAFRCLIALIFLFVFGCDQITMDDDLNSARQAMQEQNWNKAERLLERYLHQEEDKEKRWDAWQDLLNVINSANAVPKATLEYLEVMLIEYEGDDSKSKNILEKIAQTCESLRMNERAAAAWSTYISLGGLSPQEMVEGYRRLAAREFDLRHFEVSEEVLQQCLTLPYPDKDKVMCMYEMADQNMGRGRFDEVINLCNHILDIDEIDDKDFKSMRGQAGYLLADALEQTGKKQEALKQFEKARELYPNQAVIDNRINHLRKAK